MLILSNVTTAITLKTSIKIDIIQTYIMHFYITIEIYPHIFYVYIIISWSCKIAGSKSKKRVKKKYTVFEIQPRYIGQTSIKTIQTFIQIFVNQNNLATRYKLLNAISSTWNNIFHIRFVQQKFISVLISIDILLILINVSMILIWVIKWHHFNME